jgi:acyl-CoA dehydrogenase family member 9
MIVDEQQKRLAEELIFSEPKKSSFAKKLYFGLLDSSQIFPYPKIDKEDKREVDQFLSKVEEFIQKELDPVAIDREASIPDHVIKGLGELGVLGMTVPKKYGGLGMSQYAYCRTVELISRCCGSTALFVNAHQSIGLKALLLFGNEEQRQQWLPNLAQGKTLAAFSLTEPNAGSDASGVETRAVYIPEKNVYRLNGKKQWTTNGSIASVLTVMAQVEVETPQGKQDKITAFLVNPEMPGFNITAHALEKVGMRGSKTANLEFTNLDVPKDNILGPLGGGLKVCLTVLDFGRTTFGAACTGAAKSLVEKAVSHAINRIQFKKPLASFTLVKKKIASMSALAYAMEAVTYMTAGLVDSNVEDFMLEAAMLKVFASDSLWQILYETMQILGGRSFFTDQPYERMMRDARLNMIGEGSNEVMRAFIGVVGMRDVGMQLKSMVEAFQNPFRKYEIFLHFIQQRWDCLKGPKIPLQNSLFDKEANKLSNSIRRFGHAVLRLLGMHRENILEKQLLLDRIASSAMAIYTTISVLSKIDSDLLEQQGNTVCLSNDISVAKFYCQMAFDCIDVNLGSLFNNRDQDIEKVSDQITGLKFS